MRHRSVHPPAGATRPAMWRAIFCASAVLLGTGPARAADTGMSHQGHGSITPADLPGKPTRALQSTEIFRQTDDRGRETVVFRTVRAPGTRAPIHFHDEGGLTCVLEGEMTLYLEGTAPSKAAAGQCYFMPSGKTMSGVNGGTTNAVLLDIFTVKAGTSAWRVTEEGMEELQQQFPPAAAQAAAPSR